MLYSRISSGLDFLDASVGGLYSNRSYLLRGPAQSGRTTVTLQFLLAGLENGESGLLISSDRIENIILRAEAMGISLEPYLVDNRLILMEFPREITSGQFQLGNIVHLLGEIEQYTHAYNCSRMVVDTLIPLLVSPNEPHFVNYVYSLINSFDELRVSTFLTVGEPNSPSALKIIQLLEDAVVGSFSLSRLQTKQGEQRQFSIHKLVNPLNSPTTFKISIEYGIGVVQDMGVSKAQSAALSAAGGGKGVNVADLPLQITLLDKDEETKGQLEEIFKEGTVICYETEEDFAIHLYSLDSDLLLLNANQPSFNWRQLLGLLRDAYPKLPMFLLTDGRSAEVSYQKAKQVGADGLFVKPIQPLDIKKAFEKSLSQYDMMDDLIARRSPSMRMAALPEDVSDAAVEVPSVSKGLDEEVHLTPLPDFKENLVRQIWRSNQNQGEFSLVSFKTVYINPAGPTPAVPQGLELVKRMAFSVISSLRGLNDVACRYMDKVVALLEDTTKEGAQAFAKRVTQNLRDDLAAHHNLQLNKHFYVLSASAVYPDDGDNVNDLLAQVTEVSRNFVKSLG